MLEHELVAAAAELPVAHLGVRVQPLWRERIARHVRECAAGGGRAGRMYGRERLVLPPVR
jgi:hypothetical protein